MTVFYVMSEYIKTNPLDAIGTITREEYLRRERDIIEDNDDTIMVIADIDPTVPTASELDMTRAIKLG